MATKMGRKWADAGDKGTHVTVTCIHSREIKGFTVFTAVWLLQAMNRLMQDFVSWAAVNSHEPEAVLHEF
jgi:hypothetical protein